MEDAKIAAQLAALGQYLLAQRNETMRAWRGSVKNDPELTTARTLSRSRFDDYIPALLRAFSGQLLAWPGSGIVAAEAEQEQRGAEHGAHRWQEGYALPEVAREWLHLHLTLLDLFERHAIEAGLSGEAMVIARRMLVSLCGGGVSRSVTEYTRLMQAEAAGRVRDLEAALQQLNELQRERADLWREAAHDLRNTVGLVSNASGILRRDDAPAPVRAKSLAALQSGVSSLSTMLNGLLSLARLEAGLESRKVAPFDAGGLLQDVCARLEADAEARGVSLRATGPESLPAEGDEEKIRQIASELILNALQSSRQGAVTVHWAADTELELLRWTLTVTNSAGAELSSAAAPVMKELERIAEGQGTVEPHAGASASAHAAGIGLSIVKHLCELLDGTLELSENASDSVALRVVFPRRYELR